MTEATAQCTTGVSTQFLLQTATLNYCMDTFCKATDAFDCLLELFLRLLELTCENAI
ncbi:MAG: hypothetical protein ABL931_04180 [Usitatibacteraceae bacterium]